MKKAFLFPGQASQFVGMANDLYNSNNLAKNAFQQASDLMHVDLAKICFEGPIEKLTETDITQPAVFVHSYIVSQLVKEKGLTADVVAGHSLGEFSALVAAEVLTFEDALNIVVKRGRLMKECNEQTEGTMAAIMKFDIDQIQQACEEIDDVVQVANYNSDAQIVISGSVSGVHKAMELIKSKGARIVKELQVGGAFHSPLMKPAEDELAKIINQTEYKDASTDVYPNVTAKATRSGSELKSLSIKQLTATVLWFDTLLNMNKNSVGEMIELGPGSVLSGIAKRLPFEVEVKAIGTLEEINQG